MLITTVYKDATGALHSRTDTGANRRVITREVEQSLPQGAHIIGLTIVTDDDRKKAPRQLTLI